MPKAIDLYIKRPNSSYNNYSVTKLNSDSGPYNLDV